MQRAALPGSMRNGWFERKRRRVWSP